MADVFDKKFIYALAIIVIITAAALTIIDATGKMVEQSRSSSWYIWCDLETKSCSCNIYGNAPLTQVVVCMNFMQDYYSGESGIPNEQLVPHQPPVIVSIEAEVS